MAQPGRPALLKPEKGRGLQGRETDKVKERRYHQGQGRDSASRVGRIYVRSLVLGRHAKTVRAQGMGPYSTLWTARRPTREGHRGGRLGTRGVPDPGRGPGDRAAATTAQPRAAAAGARVDDAAVRLDPAASDRWLSAALGPVAIP